jgi:uncharacterized protein YgiM (DUF1202 family)
MSKYALFFLVMTAILLSAGCQKEEPVKTAAAVEEVLVVEEEVPAGEVKLTAESFVYPLRVGMWLYNITDETGAETDVTRAAEAIPLGEKLQLVAGDPRKATNLYDNRVYDYFQVRRDTGKEGLVFANQLTTGSVLAVVSDEKANLYHSPKNVDASDYILPRKVVLGVFPETERDGFVQIEAFDPVSQAYRRNMFIKTSMISYTDVDVQSSILLQTAEALDADKEKNRREALLSSALSDYPGSIFAEDIRALTVENSALPVQKTEALFRVTDDNVNIRENPDVSSRVIAQLTATAEIQAVEETIDTFTIDGWTARWYHITQPVDGWVFGGWLEDISW